MATYAIGDIQGCYQTLQKLLNRINFDPKDDTLWLAGDLINRGKDSLATLEFIYRYKENIRCVLGNHDLHFLAVESGAHQPRRKDTFTDILSCENRHLLADWLKQQPLFHYDKSLNFAMVHAGIPVSWSLQQCLAYSQEVSDFIQSTESQSFFQAMYGDHPNQWDEQLTGLDRLRYITNALTRMRFCYADGALELTNKLAPGQQASELQPWFSSKRWSQNDESQNFSLIFGHWASLEGKCQQTGLYALDTGCVWGQYLTALRLEDKTLFQVKSIE
ncbi:symmetrical bis(5'-nucleosyl)-tetraphosphatase [Aliikangiella coralliicola]|uniref:bis(5'-nucleosyl)-tetraphosphatase (symmetrical) n=1 Tax=Aliikangiella coralliicola TaxID=2592383 RepID=A0A545UH40_9GAMM|nr:symmetrical bis(5'-nucleosyl)-tetraphosphatase [Aliikangiella coralliicola]TQV88782.1 symmetrical bis(5'-nucleosyl)-tetraphosphatase [Aliikangiella coralliicola]